MRARPGAATATRPGQVVDGWLDELAEGDVILHARRAERELGRSLRFRAPARTLVLAAGDDPRPLLAELDAELGAGRAVAGYLAYEAGDALLDLPPPPELPYPAAWFGVYDAVEELDHRGRPAGLRPSAHRRPLTPADRLEADPGRWRALVERARAAMRAGESYQLDLTTALHAEVDDLADAYRLLSASQPTAYCALLHAGGVQVLSCSPELFVHLERERHGVRATVRPMKGTARRGADLEEDDVRAAALAADPKARAENVMIVDLLRNDLGRVCEVGSVHVPRLFEVERYRSVLQLTSTVIGRLEPGVGLAAVFEALFPCGSVVGAPKRRSMELLRRLEEGPRGVYTGAIGYALGTAQEGVRRAVFSVAIRTLTVQDGSGRLGVGGGILVESDPAEEYRELQVKAGFLSDPRGPLGLFETMRVEHGTVLRLDRHLDRLERSAAYFALPFDRGAAAAAVGDALARASAAAVARLRLDLDEDGDVCARVAEHADEQHGELTVVVAGARIDERDPRQRHKTIDRARYDRAAAWARATGVADVLFLNRRGRVAEGAISTVFVRRGTRLLTPPLADGALPGVLRSELIDRGEAGEASLELGDLDHGLMLGNALRGLRPARLVPMPARGTGGGDPWDEEGT